MQVSREDVHVCEANICHEGSYVKRKQMPWEYIPKGKYAIAVEEHIAAYLCVLASKPRKRTHLATI
jgi:hypothetical protein